MFRLLVVIILIFLDYISKKIIFTNIELNNFIQILPIMDFAHIHNYGIAFGLFSGILSSWLIIICGLIITAIIYFMLTQTNNFIEKWGFTLIIAGAISNIMDRVIHKYVLDFIYLHYGEFYWPAFNLADIYITLGVFIILYQAFKGYKKKSIK